MNFKVFSDFMVIEVDFKVSHFFEQNSLFRLDHFEQSTGSFDYSEPKTLITTIKMQEVQDFNFFLKLIGIIHQEN